MVPWVGRRPQKLQALVRGPKREEQATDGPVDQSEYVIGSGQARGSPGGIIIGLILCARLQHASVLHGWVPEGTGARLSLKSDERARDSGLVVRAITLGGGQVVMCPVEYWVGLSCGTSMSRAVTLWRSECGPRCTRRWWRQWYARWSESLCDVAVTSKCVPWIWGPSGEGCRCSANVVDCCMVRPRGPGMLVTQE